MTGAARRVRVAAPLKDSHNLQSIRLLAAGRQQAAANDGDIDFIYLHKSVASGEGRGRRQGSRSARKIPAHVQEKAL